MTDEADTMYRPTNRQKTQEPATGLFWCSGCDANLVGAVAKCEVCGCRNSKPNRLKKPGPLP